MTKVKNKKSGFTLMELLIVIVILGVLAGVAMPIYTGMIQKAKDAEVIGILGTIRKGMMIVYNETGAYNGDPSVGFGHIDTQNLFTTQGFTPKSFTMYFGSGLNPNVFSVAIQEASSPNCFAIDQAGTITSASDPNCSGFGVIPG